MRYSKWPRQKQHYITTGKTIYEILLGGIILGGLFVALAWTLSNALTVSERNQREMLCRSAETSRNPIYLEKCSNPDFVTLKD